LFNLSSSDLRSISPSNGMKNSIDPIINEFTDLNLSFSEYSILLRNTNFFIILI